MPVYHKISVTIGMIISELINNKYIRRKFESSVKHDNKVAIITGANAGIGRETALQLSLYGVKVIMACRDTKSGESAADYIRSKNPSAKLAVLELDLASINSVHKFCERVHRLESVIDLLVNNAGVFGLSEDRTSDGHETQFATNHLGHFLLTLLLLDLLRQSRHARIVNVASKIHTLGRIHFEDINLAAKRYSPIAAYGQSKLANVLFSRELAGRLAINRIDNVSVYCLHPGCVKTGITRHLSPTYMFVNKFYNAFKMSAELGARTTVYCCLDDGLESESGFYYDNCRRVKSMVSRAVDKDCARKLWQLSCDLVKLNDCYRLNTD